MRSPFHPPPALLCAALNALLHCRTLCSQITWRKRANESPADYGALMDAVGGGLLQATQALGLLLRPADPLPPGARPAARPCVAPRCWPLASARAELLLLVL